MIGWGLAFIKIGDSYYGTGTSCWFSLEVGDANRKDKLKEVYDSVVDNIMKYYNKGELRAMSLPDVERFPSDSTAVLEDGKITYTDREKKIHRVPTKLHWNPWALLYTDEGLPTMDLDELDDWAHFEYIKDAVDKRLHEQKLAQRRKDRAAKKAALT